MLDFLYGVIISPIKFVLGIFYFMLYRVFSSEGFAIVGLSAIVTLLVLPLYNMADAWQDEEREKQRKMKSKLDDIKAAFRGDERHMITNTYYRQQHYHPLMQLRSVIGVAIQVPFFIAAYHYLSHLTVLDGVSFLFLNDLSKPDGLLEIGSLSINIMPILMTVINLMSAAVYGKKLTGKEIGQLVFMALVFLVLLYTSPSGLVLYWTMNNVFSLIKNIFHRTAQPGRNFRLMITGVFWGLFLFCIYTLIPQIAKLFTFIKPSFSLANRLTLCIVFAILTLISYFLPQIFTRAKTYGIFNKQLRDETRKEWNILFILSCSLLAILAGLVVPLSLIVSSPHEFAQVVSASSKNPLTFIPIVLSQSIGLLAFYPLMIYCLFKERVKYSLMLLWLVVSVVAVLNVFLFPGNYGNISTALTFDSSLTFNSVGKNEIFINLFVLCVVSIAILLLFYFHKSKWLNSMLSICILVLSVMSVKNFAEIKKSHNEFIKLNENISSDKKDKSYVNKEITPFFKFSKTKQNVVVIMLDRAVSNYFEEALKFDPTLKDRMSGFTFYPNTASFNGHTVMGAPPIFGGYEYTPVEMNKREDIALVDKHNEALLMLPTIFKNAGYHCTFADPVYAGHSWTPDVSVLTNKGFESKLLTGRYSRKWINDNKSQIPLEQIKLLLDDTATWTEKKIKNNLLHFSIFRELPAVCRPVFYNDGCWMDIEQYRCWMDIEQYKSEDNKIGLETCIDAYSQLAYLPQLCTYDSDVGELVMFTNDLTHNGYEVYPPDFIPGKRRDSSFKTDYKFPYNDKDKAIFSLNVCALEVLCDWWEKMKAEGVYDNTKIIIVADHGYDIEIKPYTSIFPIYDDARAYAFYNPLLLVKDFNATGEVKTSYEFMTNADVPTLAVSHLPEEFHKNPFTGKVLNSEEKNDGITIIGSHKHSVSEHGKYKFDYTSDEVFYVKDNIFVKENWSGAKPVVEHH